MKQEKIGAFIAKCRKEKKLTQAELGRRLGVSCQTISKWERGINLPDIFILPELSKSLEVDVDELLKSEKITKADSKLDILKGDQEELFNDSLRSYEKLSKKKNLRSTTYLLLFLIIIVAFFSLMYFFSNYGRIKIYSIDSVSDNLFFKGKIISNPNGNLIIVNNFRYSDESVGTIAERKVKRLKLSILNGDKIIISYEKLFDDNEELEDLNQLLSQISLEHVIKNINKSELENFHIVLNTINEDDKVEEIECEIMLEKEFENNKFYY